jgi:type III secretory pathway component EscU
LIYSAKNIFSLKLKTDILRTEFHVIALGLLIYFTFEKSGALFNAVSSIKASQAEMLEIWSLNFTHDDTEIQKNIKN